MGDGNKVEFLVAVCALVTSVIAIWVAWDQSRVMRAQQDGMVYPVLQIDGFVSRSAEGTEIGVRLENSGVGPALIESVTAMADGDILESLEKYRGSLPKGYEISWTGLGGRAVAPGDSLDALRFEWTPDEITSESLNAAVASWGEVDFEICYCSVFQKCWITNMDATRAENVKACRVNDTDIFEQFGMARVSAAPGPLEEANP